LVAISVAKGLEPDTGKRMSEVYAEELAGLPIVCVGGPCLATELASGLPTASVWAGSPLELAREAGRPFDAASYQLTYTDDVVGVELCSMMKNVAAIGLGMLDGIGKPTGEGFKHVKVAPVKASRTRKPHWSRRRPTRSWSWWARAGVARKPPSVWPGSAISS